MLEANAKDTNASVVQKNRSSKKIFLGYLQKKRSRKNFSGDLQNKRVFEKTFQAISKKSGQEKIFSVGLQNFNHSKNSPVLEPRTGQFLMT